MYPVFDPPVTMSGVLLGVTTMTHAVASRLLPLPGAGVYDPAMPVCLVTVAQLLAAGYRVIFRLSQDRATDGVDKITYPNFGYNYPSSGHYAKLARFCNHSFWHPC